nr:DNA adenine methylase [Wohlfahrtiimonas chitiniclastica]
MRYPGGKTKFVPYITSVLQDNNLVGCDYYEIYAGGAGVALSLLFSELCRSILINDADYSVYAFWKAVVEHNDDLVKLIEETPITMDVWYKQREIFQNIDGASLLEVAFSTFFLNRTNRSGILKGGVIGGKAQTGQYTLDARFNKKDLIKRIVNIGKKADKILVKNQDALDLIKNIDAPDNDCFIYLDPPYYVKGQGLYRNFYTHDDHVEIKNALSIASFPWLISYDDNHEIRKIYDRYRAETHILNYSAQTKTKGNEIIIFSDNLIIPS